jgi:hypothetical protein
VGRSDRRLLSFLHFDYDQSQPVSLLSVLKGVSKIYSAITLGSYCATAILLCAATLYYEPVVGDLTRLGGYSENDFGWEGTQKVFKPALAKAASLAEHYDIVVVGDSFSARTTKDRQTPNGGFWTDFLAERTGLTVGVFDLDKTSLEQVLGGHGYISSPPKLLVYQSVERALDTRFAEKNTHCSPTPASDKHLLPRPLGLAADSVARDKARTLNEARLNQTIDRVKKSLRRSLLHDDGGPVLRTPLSRAGMFSNTKSSEVLLLADDLRKKQWSSKQIDAMRCAMLRHKATVEANGSTKFVALIAPDKSTVYADYLPTGLVRAYLCAALSGDGATHVLCVDDILRAAVASGIKDVYLPNDTHWASAGADLVARSVAEYAAGNTSAGSRTAGWR